MSLLMQALRKAERAKQAMQHDEEPDKPSEAFGELPAPAPMTLSLSPLDDAAAPQGNARGPDSAAPAHVPIDAAGLDCAPEAAASAPQRPAAVPVQAPDEPVQPPRATAAARARTAATGARIDRRALRIAALGTLVALVLATFAYLYWQAMYGSGSSRDLPMVPMPGQNAAPLAAAAPLVLLEPPAAEFAGPAGPAPAPAAPAPAAPSSDAPLHATPAPERFGGGAPVPERFGGAAPAQAAQPVPRPERFGTVPAAPAGRGPVSERFGAAGAPMGAPPETAAPSGMAEAQAPSGLPQLAPPAPVAAPDAPEHQAPAAAPELSAIRIARSTTPAHVDSALQNGFRQFNAGNMEGARRHYAEMLARDANNRDALLGMAAVALRESDFEQAQARYQRLLELDPNDPDAVARLSDLPQTDAGRAESRLRRALQHSPDAAPLLFALGNLYAQQRRWPEAQQAYFRAYSGAPDNADYAFNLAVGLDRLNQGKLAARYYRRALDLASKGRHGGFDQAAVRTRIAELGEQ